MKSEVAVESLIPAGPASVLRAAGGRGWHTVATLGTGEFKDKVGTTLVLRGWSGPRGKFVVVYHLADDGTAKAGSAYWWTREHEAVADLPYERVKWQSEYPTPVRVSLVELKRLLKGQV